MASYSTHLADESPQRLFFQGFEIPAWFKVRTEELVSILVIREGCPASNLSESNVQLIASESPERQEI